MPPAAAGMDTEIVLSSKVSQRKTDIMISLVCEM